MIDDVINLQFLFLFVCVPVRLTIASTPYFFFKKRTSVSDDYILIGVLCLSFISHMFLLYQHWNDKRGIFNREYPVWWSRKYHMGITSLLVLTSLIGLFESQFPAVMLTTILLYVDVLGGVFYRFYLNCYY